MLQAFTHPPSPPRRALAACHETGLSPIPFKYLALLAAGDTAYCMEQPQDSQRCCTRTHASSLDHARRARILRMHDMT